MSRETVQKHVVQKPNTSRPFYLWLIRSKKIYSSEFHKQIHDFDPFTPSLHNQLSNFNQGYLKEKNCFLSISNWPMLYCNLKNWGELFMFVSFDNWDLVSQFEIVWFEACLNLWS